MATKGTSEEAASDVTRAETTATTELQPDEPQ